MKTKQTPGTIFRRIALLIVLWTSMPAYGHDPLSDEHDQHGGDVHSTHDNANDRRPNLSYIRDLVTTFRESGDDRHLDEAWDLLKPSVESISADPETLITASFVVQSRHEFDYAVDLVNRALAINGRNDEAWLLLASIHLVLGDTESASMACNNLHNVPPLVTLTCKARIALATGDHERAFARLSKVLEVVDPGRLSTELLAWSFSVAGDLAAASDEPARSSEMYRRSLELVERTQVRAALVDVLLSQNDDDNAWHVLNHGSQALPLLIRKLIVAKRLDRLDGLQSELEKVQHEFAAWIANEDWLHAREMARFYIDVVERPALARRLALINISLQHEPEDRRLERRTAVIFPPA